MSFKRDICNTSLYPDGIPDGYQLTAADLPKTTDIEEWQKLNRPLRIIKDAAQKTVTTNISHDFINSLKSPVVLTTTIKEAKWLCTHCPRHELVIFGMKDSSKLLLMKIGGTDYAFHKIWYLFCNDLRYSDYQIVNENNDDQIIIGLGFRKPENQNKDYLFCWGDNLSKKHLQQYSQNVYLVSNGMIVQRYP